MNWITAYNRAPGVPGRLAVLFAAGIVGTVTDMVAATRELYERGRSAVAVHSPSTEGDERA